MLNASAPRLASKFEQENFAFFSTQLRGIKEQPPRWQTCAGAVDSSLGEALGQLYVEKAFGADSKARMKALVDALTVALEQDINQLDWMTQETKVKALEKLRLLNKNKIGYPDAWRDYSKVTVSRTDYLGNSRRADRDDVRRDYEELGKPVDRTRWGMTPPTVNAYYSSQLAEIVFPAGILQPPFFDRSADEAVNFGGIGAVIGHELTHGFDDQGRKFDGKGNLTDWWTEADGKAFEQRASCVADQYCEVLAGEGPQDRRAGVPQRPPHAGREHRRQRRRPHRVHGADEHAEGQAAHGRRPASRPSSASSSASRRCGARTSPTPNRSSASSPTRTPPAPSAPTAPSATCRSSRKRSAASRARRMAPENRCRVW